MTRHIYTATPNTPSPYDDLVEGTDITQYNEDLGPTDDQETPLPNTITEARPTYLHLLIRCPECSTLHVRNQDILPGSHEHQELLAQIHRVDSNPNRYNTIQCHHCYHSTPFCTWEATWAVTAKT